MQHDTAEAGGTVFYTFQSLLKLDGNLVLLKIIATNLYTWQDIFVKHNLCTNHFKIKIPNLPSNLTYNGKVFVK